MRQQRVRLGFCRSAVLGRRILGRGDQDMAGATLFFRRVALCILVVIGLDVGVAHGHLAGRCSGVEHHVLGLDLLRRLETAAALVVVGLEHVVGDLDLGRIVGCLEQQFLHLALLLIDLGQARRKRFRREGAVLHGCIDLLQRQVLAQIGFERRRRQALRGQQHLVTLDIELAFSALQIGNLQDALLQRCVRHRQIAAAGFHGQCLLRNQVVEDALARIGRIQHARIELRAVKLAQPVGLLALGRVQFFLGNFLTAHLGDDIALVTHAGVAFDAEQCKRGDDEQQEQELHQALVGTDEIEHGLPIADK